MWHEWIYWTMNLVGYGTIINVWILLTRIHTHVSSIQSLYIVFSIHFWQKSQPAFSESFTPKLKSSLTILLTHVSPLSLLNSYFHLHIAHLFTFCSLTYLFSDSSLMCSTPIYSFMSNSLILCSFMSSFTLQNLQTWISCSPI